jgi:hypothetical protein
VKTLNRFIVTALLTLFATQTLALDFTQATKDTTFVLSDANKKIQVTFDQFALFIDWSMHLKNESGKEIDSVTFERTTGVVPSSVQEVSIKNVIDYYPTLYKTWDLIFTEDTINKIKADGGKKFTLTTYYAPSSTYQGSFIRAHDEWLPQRTLNICWEGCGKLTNTFISTLPSPIKMPPNRRQ